jgi:hypothetical protein
MAPNTHVARDLIYAGLVFDMQGVVEDQEIVHVQSAKIRSPCGLAYGDKPWDRLIQIGEGWSE